PSRRHPTAHEAVAVTLAELTLEGLDLADDDAVQPGWDQPRHRRHLDPGVDQAIGGLLRREVEVDELPDPAIRNLHGVGAGRGVIRTASRSGDRSRTEGGCRRSRT